MNIYALLALSSIGLSMAALGAGESTTARPGPRSDGFSQASDLDTSSVIVQLKGDPLSTHSATRPAPGRKIDFNSDAVRSYRARLSAGRNEFRSWLRAYAPDATISSEYDISLNALAVELNGTPRETIARAPMVERVEFNALYRPTLSQSYQVINAPDAWTAAGGRSLAGAGVKIGHLDTGIDETHEFFDPTGFSYPVGFPKCDAADSTTHTPNENCKYVSPKVIVAKVFKNKADRQELDAQAIQGHGTSTAGIEAGMTGKTAVVEGVSINDLSGIAPGAWLGNYNVFPGTTGRARSEDILNAIEAAVADGMDVLNLSLGDTATGNKDLMTTAVDNAVDAGVVVAVAGGNSGPGSGTISSPGRARKAITVGASSNPHFFGESFTYPSSGGTTIGAAGGVGGFDPLPTASYDLFDTASDGCTTVGSGASGKLAVINRGTCTFSTKIRNAIAAGAVGVLVIQNVASDPFPMYTDFLGGDDLPAVMIGKNEGEALRASGATTASAVAIFSEFVTGKQDIEFEFGSQGPTEIDFAIKPDLITIGLSVVTSDKCVDSPVCPDEPWVVASSGTSYATPHITGSAAVLLGLHPDWTPAQVKSALVNRADLVIKDAPTGMHDVGPTAQGAGRENLSVAADATTWLDPVSASFGRVSLGHAASLAITLSNPTGGTQTFSVSKTRFTPDTFGDTVNLVYDAGIVSAGDDRIVVPETVTVPANGSTSMTVTVNRGQPSGTVIQGWINLDGDGANDLHFAYYAIVGR